MELFTEDTHYRANQLCCRHNGRTIGRVVCDSMSPDDSRLTTLELVFPRIVLAEFNTHRVFSRNSASSRAIPIKKMLARVNEDPYIPEAWTSNQKGMQGEVITDPKTIEHARAAWLQARNRAVGSVESLLNLGIHKQTTNRLLEPFMWHTVIVTATEWSNFQHLRAHSDAHPSIQHTGKAVIGLLDAHEPTRIDWNEWHLPFIHDRDRIEVGKIHADAGVGSVAVERSLAMLSSARCARVSYLTHDGIRDLSKDFELHDRLFNAGHMSPFEHPATASRYVEYRGSNFGRPWVQYRKMLPFEWDVYADPDRPWEPAP